MKYTQIQVWKKLFQKLFQTWISFTKEDILKNMVNQTVAASIVFISFHIWKAMGPIKCLDTHSSEYHLCSAEESWNTQMQPQWFCRYYRAIILNSCNCERKLVQAHPLIKTHSHSPLYVSVWVKTVYYKWSSVHYTPS